MEPTLVFFFLLSFLLSFPSHGAAQQPTQSGALQPEDPPVSYRPRIAVVVGIFSIMLSVTFLLLMYAKFCHFAGRADLLGHVPEDHQEGLLTAPPRSSGVDKTVIESLPFFRFSSLKGSREGLDCAVCLSRFEGAELLRLLPKCKHAFHIACVDRWLEAHSSCPLCRHRVLLEDLTLFKYSTSSRFLFRDPSVHLGEADQLELYVERELGDRVDSPGRSSFSKADSLQKDSKKDETPLAAGEDGEQRLLHRFQHRIIVSDVVFKNRWSDLNSSDLVSLNTEMLRALSSGRFPAAMGANSEAEKSASWPENGSSADETMQRIKEEMEKKRLLESKASQMNSTGLSAGFPSGSDRDLQGSTLSKSLNPSGNNRSMSEITNIPRFADAVGRIRGGRDGGDATGSSKNDEKVSRVWLPIARRTVRWFAGREKRPEISEQTRVASNV